MRAQPMTDNADAPNDSAEHANVPDPVPAPELQPVGETTRLRRTEMLRARTRDDQPQPVGPVAAEAMPQPVENLDPDHMDQVPDDDPANEERHGVQVDIPVEDLLKLIIEHAEDDYHISIIKLYLEKHELPEDVLKNVRLSKTIVRQSEVYEVLDGVLFRRCTDQVTGNLKLQPVIPRSLIHHVVTMTHELNSHLGKRRTLQQLTTRMWWIGMAQDVSSILDACVTCQRARSRENGSGKLRPIPPATHPMQRIAMDIVGLLKKTSAGSQYILVITDYLTRFVQIYALKHANAMEVGDCLLDYIARFGPPEQLLTDRGTALLNDVLTSIERVFIIHKLNTTPYHRQTDGLVERFNATMETMLRSYSNREKREWDMYLSLIAYAYNTTIHASTQATPYELMFGHQCILPFEVAMHNSINAQIDSETAEARPVIRA